MTVQVPAMTTQAPEGAARVHDIVDVDLMDPRTYERGVPHAAFDALRERAPVAWHDETVPPPERPSTLDGTLIPSPGFWAVTRHDLVHEVSKTPELFSSWAGGTAIYSSDETGLVVTRQMMLNMDPPEHSRLRHILQPIFTPRAVHRLHDSVVSHSKEIVDAIAGKGGCEFVDSVSAELPVRVLSSLLGMPYEDRRLLFEWTNALLTSDDPDESSGGEHVRRAMEAMFAYGKAIADDRRANPRDDIVSMIANAELDGEKLSDLEFSLFWLLLVVAGNETTRNTLSGGIVALHEHDLWGKLRADRALLPTAVDEIIRHVSSVIHFRRTALQDVELGGQQVRAGDKVVVFYSAANRDPAVFDRPHELDLARSPNPHLAFGVGPHFCLGSHLAKLQLTTILNELLDHFPTLAVNGDVRRFASNFISGIRELPVSFAAAA